MKGDVLKYNGFIKIHDHLSAKNIELLNMGNLIKKESNRLFIFKGSHFIEQLPSSARLFNFK